jgi:hypothetical protein
MIRLIIIIAAVAASSSGCAIFGGGDTFTDARATVNVYLNYVVSGDYLGAISLLAPGDREFLEKYPLEHARYRKNIIERNSLPGTTFSITRIEKTPDSPLKATFRFMRSGTAYKDSCVYLIPAGAWQVSEDLDNLFPAEILGEARTALKGFHRRAMDFKASGGKFPLRLEDLYNERLPQTGYYRWLYSVGSDAATYELSASPDPRAPVKSSFFIAEDGVVRVSNDGPAGRSSKSAE